MLETHSLILIRLTTNHLKPCPLKKNHQGLSFKLCPIHILKRDFENKLEEFESSFEQDEIMDFFTLFHIFVCFFNV